MREIVLIGGGGHCHSCIDVIESTENFSIAGIVDNNKVGQSILGYPVIGTDEDLEELVKKYKYFMVTVGQIKTSKIRKKIFNKLKSLNVVFPTIISKRAYVSKHANIGEGSIVMHDAIVNAKAVIGKNCIINTKCLIEHDSTVGDNSHIATGAILNGNCIVGTDVFVGSNTVVRNGVHIKDGEVVPYGVKYE